MLFLSLGDLPLVLENPSIYLSRFDPAASLHRQAAIFWAGGCSDLLPCEPLVSSSARACAALWIIFCVSSCFSYLPLVSTPYLIVRCFSRYDKLLPDFFSNLRWFQNCLSCMSSDKPSWEEPLVKPTCFSISELITLVSSPSSINYTTPGFHAGDNRFQ